MVLLLLDSELVSGVLGVPAGGVVRVVAHADRLVAVLQLRGLDRELVTVPQIVTASLVVGVQLKRGEKEKSEGGVAAAAARSRTQQRTPTNA